MNVEINQPQSVLNSIQQSISKHNKFHSTYNSQFAVSELKQRINYHWLTAYLFPKRSRTKMEKAKRPDFYGLISDGTPTRSRLGRIAIWEQFDNNPSRPVFCGNIEIDGKKYPIALWAQRPANGEGKT